MAQKLPTPAPAPNTLNGLTKRQMERAFEAWENDYRIDPSKYRTDAEITALSATTVSAERTDYFFELLTLEQQRG